MLCPNCGHNNADESAFCLQCGNKLNAEAESAQSANPANPANPSAEQKKSKKDIFVSEDEYAVATLKNGMAVHLLAGEGLFGEKAIVSNKRVYYRNLRLNLSTKAAANNSNSGDFVVDIKDVTGTRITQNNPWGFLILAAIALIGAFITSIFELILPALLFVVMYLLLKKTKLEVQYAGGVIPFDLRGYSMKNVRAFRNAIYTVKDSLDAEK